jgi:hypothetical protein
MARLRVEQISRRGLCRAVGVGVPWLLGVLAQGLEALPAHRHVQPVTCHGNVLMKRLEGDADDLNSVVQKKAKKPWL